MFKLQKSKIKNDKGTQANTELNLGKKEVQTAGYMTLTQQIQGMFDPLIGSQMQHKQVETKTPATDKDYNEIDTKGIRYNSYKLSKMDTINLGREANEEVRLEIDNHKKTSKNAK